MPSIRSLQASPIQYRLKSPLVTAAGKKKETHNVLVMLTLEDGTRGLAEASSSIAMPQESQSNMLDAIKLLRPELRGKPIEEYRDLIQRVWRLAVYHPTAAAAVECALLDAYTRYLKQPLAAFFGGKISTIETDLTISLGKPVLMHQQAKDAVRKGFRRLKIKLSGALPALDLERMRAVRKAAPRALLVADGNQGFRLSHACDFLHRLKREGIAIHFFEQPLPKHDLRSMRLLRQRTHVPLFVDESVLSPADAIRVFEAEAADGIIIKVAKSGLLGALDILHITQRFKKRLGIGCMEESKLGLAASVHLACGTGAFEWVDLDSVFLLAEHPRRGGFHIRGSRLSVTGIRSGIGI